MPGRCDRCEHDKHRGRRTLIFLLVIIFGPILFIALGELSYLMAYGHL